MARSILILISCIPIYADETHIAPTEAQSPEAQRELFHLPPGFEIQLVLADPEIGQPMNLNFDARGRLWVTSSVEYPFPAQVEGLSPRYERFPQVGGDQPRDWLTIASDFGADGRASRVQRFAEGLNIPIGQTPAGDGSEGIVYSIPAISRYRDTDGDGRADRIESLYEHFGNIDTHGMANGFTPWIDGWVYGCHGFRNTSKIVDSQGNVTELFSGNTYRFRPDGSKFELYTQGQVNPFGLTIDPLGNVYSADCHSRPLYQLLRGGTYFRPSWGQPIEDPIGLAPDMIDHDHGSTGICGPAYYAADHFPAEYRDNIFLCNPVTGRVHRDKLVASGSTLIADTQEDFIRCDDPWFRPVDAIVGPDGALYIADFYNAIIGHYEVPLEHEKRDRTQGRVWRVVYREAPPAIPNLAEMDLAELVQILDTENQSLRTLATQQLTDRMKAGDLDLIRQSYPEASALARSHLLWVLEHVAGLSDAELDEAIADESRIVRVHAQKILAERSVWREQERSWALRALDDGDAFVRRAAADAMGRHAHPRFIDPLLEAWDRADEGDTHLIHAARMSIRQQLLNTTDWSTERSRSKPLLEIAAATKTAEAARFALLASNANTDHLETALRVNADLLDGESLEALVNRLSEASFDPKRSIDLIGALSVGMPSFSSETLRSWASATVERILGEEAAHERSTIDSAIRLVGSMGLNELSGGLLARADKGNLVAVEAILEIDPERGSEATLIALAVAPAAKQTELAQVLSASALGSVKLLEAIETGRAPLDLLRNTLIRQQIGETNPRLIALTSVLPDKSEETLSLMKERRAEYDVADRSFDRGKVAFQNYCSVCHRIDGEGGAIGPNLDGVNVRGVDRLIEDILDPSRNVDPAFSVTTIRARGGKTISGIGSRVEGGEIVLTDTTGQLHRVPEAEVIEQVHSRASLMPAALGAQIPASEFPHLLEFLLAERAGR